MARRGLERCGAAGMAWPGRARQGADRQAWHGQEWLGAAGTGKAGAERLGLAGHGLAGPALIHHTTGRFSVAKNDRPERDIDSELEWIERRDGVIRPEAVVEFARNERTALHSQFTWDDTAAAKAHRLWQARQVIAVRVKIIPQSEKVTRAFVSLPSDRAGGGGYRSIVRVLSDDERRAELLASARDELKTFRRKYQTLSELAGIFAAIDGLELQRAVSA